MNVDAIEDAYRLLCKRWQASDFCDRELALDRFKVLYSFNSGNIENSEITYHDTAEVFDKGGLSNFTGSVRTVFEIGNLKHSWEWLGKAAFEAGGLDVPMLLDAHRVLTAGTYDDARWEKGERPGTFKVNDYRVAGDVGLEPDEVQDATQELLEEVSEAITQSHAEKDALTIAAYAHARLVEIHPFADGNGRAARLLANLILLRLGRPPCAVHADDRIAYFGALDAFHIEGELEPFKSFLMIQTLKSFPEMAEPLS